MIMYKGKTTWSLILIMSICCILISISIIHILAVFGEPQSKWLMCEILKQCVEIIGLKYN